MSGRKLGHLTKFKENLVNTQNAAILDPLTESQSSIYVLTNCPSCMRRHLLLCNQWVNCDEILSITSPKFLQILFIHEEFWFPLQPNEKHLKKKFSSQTGCWLDENIAAKDRTVIPNMAVVKT